MIDIQPQYLKLAQLLSERLFRIPEYQRAYSWTSRQRTDLFRDIEKVAGPDAGIHFMATVVGLRRAKRVIITDEHQVVEVVDGQQRLTTLILLLKATALALSSTDSIESRLRRELEELLVKPDAASLLLLQTNHDSSHYFADYLRTGKRPAPDKATTLADREFLGAMLDCEAFVAEWGAKRGLVELVSLLKNRLTFIFHELADEATVYTVFEVLNSRGLDVSWFDRLKSILMGMAFETETGNQLELIDELHHLWRDIYRCIGLRQGMSTEALRFAATLRADLRPSKTQGQEAAVDILRSKARPGPPAILEVTQWVRSVTEGVDRLSADRRRNAVRKIAQTRLVATAVHLRPDLSEADREEILRVWENVTFRIYGMMTKDARTRVGDYTRLAWDITNRKLIPSAIVRRLRHIGSEFTIDRAIVELRESDRYTDWKEELRYFLYRYEEHLAHEAGQQFDNEQWNRIWQASAAQSIEHILPQSATDKPYRHWLGNLVLLPPGLNSKLGARSPAEKAEEYCRSGLFIAQEVSSDLANWDEAHIARRSEQLLAWARTEWAD